MQKYRRRKGCRSEEHTSELQSHHDLVCRLLLEKKKLSELLHDRLRELPAAETLRPACGLFQSDDAKVAETAKETWSSLPFELPPESLIARMNYFLASPFHEQCDWAKEKEHLKTAVDAYPKDADVLIAMYRLPQADEAWKTFFFNNTATTEIYTLSLHDALPI